MAQSGRELGRAAQGAARGRGAEAQEAAYHSSNSQGLAGFTCTLLDWAGKHRPEG